MISDNFSLHRLRNGWIEVIVGCMFSGKTEELIRQLRRAHLAKQSIQVFKPVIDRRYSVDNVASHDQNLFPSFVVTHASQILDAVEAQTSVVGIDEGQFFDQDLVAVASCLAGSGRRVLIAGLDTDYLGQPFGPMPQLMAIAEVVRKQYAICMVCGEAATRTQRLVPTNDSVLVGSTEAYEARCRQHFDPDLSRRLAQSLKTNSKTNNHLPTAIDHPRGENHVSV